jgi:hypothetical protein
MQYFFINSGLQWNEINLGLTKITWHVKSLSCNLRAITLYQITVLGVCQ